MAETLLFNVGEETRLFLLAQSLITDIVGANVWKNYLPQDVDSNAKMPAIVIVTDEGIPLKDFGGTNGLHNTDVEIWSYGSTDDEAVTLDGTIRGLLDGLDATVDLDAIGERVDIQDSSDQNDSPDDGGIDYRLIRRTNYLVNSYRS